MTQGEAMHQHQSRALALDAIVGAHIVNTDEPSGIFRVADSRMTQQAVGHEEPGCEQGAQGAEERRGDRKPAAG